MQRAMFLADEFSRHTLYYRTARLNMYVLPQARLSRYC